jgi:hypothetical protein
MNSIVNMLWENQQLVPGWYQQAWTRLCGPLWTVLSTCCEKINNLFQVDINRREQCCAAHYEQYCQHVVRKSTTCSRLISTGVNKVVRPTMNSIVNMLLQRCSTVTTLNNMVDNLFQVDINRREQGCAAHYEQYCQHVVTALFNCNNFEQHGWQLVPGWYQQAWTRMCGPLWTVLSTCCYNVVQL